MVMHGEKGPPDEVWVRWLAQAQGDIRLAHPKIKLLVGEDDLEFDVRIKFEKRPQARRQPAHADAEAGGDPQIAIRLFAAFIQRHLGGVELGHDLAHRAQEKFTLLGQDKAARVTMKQRNFQIEFEGAHLPAYRRLAEAKSLTRMGKRTGRRRRTKSP